MNVLAIPFKFVRGAVALEWSDLLWGYRHNFLTWKDLVCFAELRIHRGSDDSAEFELAGVSKESVWKVGELAEQLSMANPIQESQVKRKWLFICLLWLYENKSELSDPLGAVEEVYADFEYPSEIEDFVRYMPPTDGYAPLQHSEEENFQRLMGKWENYLNNSRSFFNSQ